MMLVYHELAAEAVKDVYALSPEAFRGHAQAIAEHGGSGMQVSFDDGHLSNYCLAAPVLQHFRIPAIFFITTCWTNVLDSVMTWRELRHLSTQGFAIGSHTHTHTLLTSCGTAVLRNELEVSKKLLEDHLGREVHDLSLPGGRGNTRVLRACRDAGYCRVYTSRVGEYAPATGSFPEVIGRYVVTRGTTEHTLAAYLRAEPSTLRRLRLESAGKWWIKKLVGDGLYRSAWRRIARSQSYGT